MASYIFVSPRSDPGKGLPLLDPILGSGITPTMGTCRPDLRRYVRPGDHIFVVSGSLGKSVPQYVVGGIEVGEILESQIVAFERFPENRLVFDQDGRRHGNIIVTAQGEQHELDDHSKFDSRIKNYLVGSDQIVIESSREIAIARAGSVDLLAKIFDKPKAASVREIIGRARKLSDAQVDELRKALSAMKREAKRGSPR